MWLATEAPARKNHSHLQVKGLQLQPAAADTQMAGLLQQAAAQQAYMYMQQCMQQGEGGLPGFKLLQPGGGLKRGRSQASLQETPASSAGPQAGSPERALQNGPATAAESPHASS